MARNRSTNRRRRRGRFSFLMKLLCILLIAGAVVAALTVFFKVQSITEKTLTTETLLTLVRTAGGYGMLAGIGSVDLSDAEAITFTYLGRFTVRLPWDSDLDYIFRSVQDLVNGLESNETGEINYMLLKSKGEMHFIPSAPGA